MKFQLIRINASRLWHMLSLCVCCAVKPSFYCTHKIAVHTCTQSACAFHHESSSPLVPVGLVQSPSRRCETCSSRSADLRKNQSLHSSPADETSLRLFCCLMKRCHETGTQPAASPRLLYKTSTNPPKLSDIMSTAECAVKCTR